MAAGSTTDGEKSDQRRYVPRFGSSTFGGEFAVRAAVGGRRPIAADSVTTVSPSTSVGSLPVIVPGDVALLLFALHDVDELQLVRTPHSSRNQTVPPPRENGW